MNFLRSATWGLRGFANQVLNNIILLVFAIATALGFAVVLTLGIVEHNPKAIWLAAFIGAIGVGIEFLVTGALDFLQDKKPYWKLRVGAGVLIFATALYAILTWR